MSTDYQMESIGSERVQAIIRLSIRKIHAAMDEDEIECCNKYGVNRNSASPSELKNLYNGFDEVTRQRKCPYKRGNKIAKSLAPIMLWGPPGVGKSQMVIGVTQEMGLDIVDVRLAQKDPTDMRGLPVPDEKTKAVQWFLSSEWPRDWSSRGIIFFDELTAADKTLQVSAYEMILDRKLGDVGEGKFGYEVPPGWLIVAAGNQRQDKAVSQPMSSALANRFLHVIVKARALDWINWAKKSGVHPVVIDYIEDPTALVNVSSDDKLHNMNPEFFDLEKGWPSPRSWERVSSILHAYDRIVDERASTLGANTSSTADAKKQERLKKAKNKIFARFTESSLADMIYGLVGQGTNFMPFWRSRDVSAKIFMQWFLNDHLTDLVELKSAKVNPARVRSYRSNPAGDIIAETIEFKSPKIATIELDTIQNWYNDPTFVGDVQGSRAQIYFAKVVQIWAKGHTLTEDEYVKQTIDRAILLPKVVGGVLLNETKDIFKYDAEGKLLDENGRRAIKEKVLVNMYKIINAIPLSAQAGMVILMGRALEQTIKTLKRDNVLYVSTAVDSPLACEQYFIERKKFEDRYVQSFPDPKDFPKDYVLLPDDVLSRLPSARQKAASVASVPSANATTTTAPATKKKKIVAED